MALLSAACTSDGLDPGAGAVDTVVVVPATATIAVGSTIILLAEARAANGDVLSRDVFWAAADSDIATVSDSGRVTARRAGAVQIAASVEGKSGLADVVVTNARVASMRVSPPNATLRVGESVTFTAQPRDANGTLLTGRSVSWSSSNAQVAIVNAAGRVIAQAPGATIISAQSDGTVGMASVNVASSPVASVRVTPTTLSLTVGQSAPLRADALDDDNNLLTGRVILWFSSNSSVATVSPSGTVTGVGRGSTTITATSEGKTATATVSVSIQPTITITPATSTINVNGTVQLVAVFVDDQGRIRDKNYTWTSSDTRIATVSSNGKVTGKAKGNVTIRAAASGVTGSATVTVK